MYGGPNLPPEMKDFQLGFSLGTGSTGTVYRATQMKEYAVKVVQWRNDNSREAAKREYDVARLFAECEKTVHAEAYYEFDSCSFIIQEIGTPIINYFSGNPCSMRMILQGLLDVSDALDFIHSKGYTHFDVKPSNIIVIDERARLGDFSHCLRYEQGQKYKRSMGTDVIRAPEVMAGSAHSGREDIYSLGITMYMLLTAGRTPFEEGKDKYKRQPVYSLFIHPDLLAVIQKATAYDPVDRYQTFAHFSEDIRRFMDVNDSHLDEKAPAYISRWLQGPTISPVSPEDAAKGFTDSQYALS